MSNDGLYFIGLGKFGSQIFNSLNPIYEDSDNSGYTLIDVSGSNQEQAAQEYAVKIVHDLYNITKISDQHAINVYIGASLADKNSSLFLIQLLSTIENIQCLFSDHFLTFIGMFGLPSFNSSQENHNSTAANSICYETLLILNNYERVSKNFHFDFPLPFGHSKKFNLSQAFLFTKDKDDSLDSYFQNIANTIRITNSTSIESYNNNVRRIQDINMEQKIPDFYSYCQNITIPASQIKELTDEYIDDELQKILRKRSKEIINYNDYESYKMLLLECPSSVKCSLSNEFQKFFIINNEDCDTTDYLKDKIVITLYYPFIPATLFPELEKAKTDFLCENPETFGIDASKTCIDLYDFGVPNSKKETDDLKFNFLLLQLLDFIKEIDEKYYLLSFTDKLFNNKPSLCIGESMQEFVKTSNNTDSGNAVNSQAEILMKNLKNTTDLTTEIMEQLREHYKNLCPKYPKEDTDILKEKLNAELNFDIEADVKPGTLW